MIGDSLVSSLISWEDENGTTQTLDVDVVMAATDRRTAKLTDHVVETGATITDHVIIQPEELTLELVVSQTPLKGKGFARQKTAIEYKGTKLTSKQYPLEIPPSRFQPGGFFLVSAGAQAAIGAIVGLLGGGVGASGMTGSEVQQTSGSGSIDVLQADQPVDRVSEAHDRLIEIMNGALPVTISFKGRLYNQYLLTEVELTQAAGSFGAGKFKVQARAFRTVTGTTVELPDPSDFRALANKAKGNKPAKGGTPDPLKGMKSFAAKGADSNVGKAGTNIVNGVLGTGG